MTPPAAFFDLAAARRYWRHAPSGAGKHDTAELSTVEDARLAAVWDDAFHKRFRQYPEEEAFLRGRAKEFVGKRVLSIGPGLGLHEVYYQLHGARVTCCDIVQSNLDVIRRIAELKRAAGMGFVLSAGANQPLGGPFDIVFLYGSLMTMPEDQQRAVLARAAGALAPDGRLMLMLYTWQFAARTCGWSSPDQFDPIAFARASDPSVGAEHCPWSDWHDDEKLLALTDGKLCISRRQLWNQGLFVWYELGLDACGSPASFFDAGEILSGGASLDVDLQLLAPVDADVSHHQGELCIETRPGNFAYALASPPLARTEAAIDANAIVVEGALAEGGFSLGLLDDETNAFVASTPMEQSGPFQHLLAVEELPRRYRIILSNHRSREPGISRFTVRRLRLFHREPLSP